jgi:hypothetical protein
MLGKVEREPFPRGTVHSVQKTVHDRPRQERQVGDPREKRGIEEGGRRDGHDSARPGRRGNCGDEPFDQLVGGDLLGLRLKVEDQPVTHHGFRERGDVLVGGVAAALQQRARL